MERVQRVDDESSCRFTSASVILPLMTETESLRQSVAIILGEARTDVGQILIIVCDRTKPASLDVAYSLARAYPDLIQVHSQGLPFLGGAIREGFDRCVGSHVIMMASDLETDPHDVKRLIAEAKTRPSAVITASRWREGGGFSGYDPVKFLANRIFQFTFSTLYATRLSDLTYGFRLFPVPLVKSIKWDELRHPFLLETIVKPLRLGVPVVEIPSRWRARNEGESQNTFMRNFTYFRIGLRVRFMPVRKILRA